MWLLWKTYRLYRACADGGAAVNKHALFKELPIPADTETASGLQPVGSAAPPSSSTRRSGFASIFGGGGGGGSGGDGGSSSTPWASSSGGDSAGGGGLAVATGAVWPPPR